MAYLKLFHGRASRDEQLDGWGDDGPIFGPHPYFHLTYGVEIKFDEDECHVLNIEDGFVFYGGVYYGDWSIFDGPPKDGDEDFVVEFAPNLAVMPQAFGATDAKGIPVSECSDKQTHV